MAFFHTKPFKFWLYTCSLAALVMAKTDVARRVTHDISSYLVTKRVELQVAQHRPVLADTPKFED